MSADAEHAWPARPSVPPRPAFPPRPAVPPPPHVPPVPQNPPPVPADEARIEADRPGGETNQEDEHPPPMPHETEADDHRPIPPGGSATRTDASTPTVPPQNRPPGRPAGTAFRTSSPPPRIRPPRGGVLPPHRSGEGGHPPAAAAYPLMRPSAPVTDLPDRPAAPPSAPPSRRRRFAGRTVTAAVCLVLGIGLLGGAVAGAALDLRGERSATAARFDRTRNLWHNVPVDTLFPRTVKENGAGPGRADRRWVRVAAAPDSDCRHAFDPMLTKALAPVGCARLIRATYTDETSSSVITVGAVFTRAGKERTKKLRTRFAVENLTERTDLMPRPYPVRGTAAAGFGDAQRAAWTVRVLADAPVVVYAVAGFADGRAVSDPQPASRATEKGQESAASQSGLGHDAQGLADRFERGLEKESDAAEAGA